MTSRNNNISDFDVFDLIQYDMVDENLEVAEFPNEIQITQLAINPSIDEESDEEETGSDEVTVPSTHEAISALKTIVSYVEFKYPENEQFLNAADRLQRNISQEILSKRVVQKNITEFTYSYTYLCYVDK
ncbi:uncharacterized protein LOC108917291 [Anoplophora glabripennis]|uniref:uncharacterized protein LOC108917291 n=1 Tax=Anoplophora glabripennis TaxID=217634 RepID=UPI000873D3D6|nr:uncharacterized protein LOC108917291 [Anoplophora glabripennis]